MSLLWEPSSPAVVPTWGNVLRHCGNPTKVRDRLATTAGRPYPEPMDHYLTAAEVAKLTGITPRSVNRDVAAGRLTPAVVLSRGLPRLFTSSAVEAYLEWRRETYA